MRAEPVRSCVGCRTRRDVSALVRITRTSMRIDVGGPSAGRGAWLCRDGAGVSRSCVASAIRRGAFARAWRGPVTADEHDTIAALTAAFGEGADRTPDGR